MERTRERMWTIRHSNDEDDTYHLDGGLWVKAFDQPSMDASKWRRAPIWVGAEGMTVAEAEELVVALQEAIEWRKEAERGG